MQATLLLMVGLLGACGDKDAAGDSGAGDAGTDGSDTDGSGTDGGGTDGGGTDSGDTDSGDTDGGDTDGGGTDSGDTDGGGADSGGTDGGGADSGGADTGTDPEKTDDDGDDYSEADGDCDDTDPDVHPGAEEICGNGVDDDCDGLPGDCGFEDGGIDDLADVRIDGEAWTFGQAIGLGGDLDGDGRDDVVISTSGSGSSDGAQVRIFPDPMAATTESDAATSIGWEAGREDNLGTALLSDVDLDGDGQHDLVVTHSHSVSSTATAGRLFLVPGPLTDTSLDVDDVASASFTGTGAYDYCGTTLAAADLDDDDGVDIVASCPAGGTVHLFAGASAGSGSFDDAWATLSAPPSRRTGEGLAAFDLDGDGVEDLLIGVPDASDARGAVAWFQGPVDAGLHSLSDADGTRTGDPDAALGSFLTPAGDIDGDGYDDLIASAGDLDYEDATGQAQLLSGGRGFADSDAIATIQAEPYFPVGPRHVTGDFDDDGQLDLVVGGPSAGEDYEKDGRLWIFDGPVAGSFVVSDADTTLVGPADLAAAGIRMRVSDVDADGVDDLVLTGTGWEGNLGAAWILRGRGL